MIKALGLWEENASVTVPIIDNPAHITGIGRKLRAPCRRRIRRGVNPQSRHYGMGRTAFEAKRVLEAYEFLFSCHLKLLSLRPRLVK